MKECGAGAGNRTKKPDMQKRMHKKILYIKCAESIIRNEGMSALNIRRIATELGYNSATLYNYFEDLEELILFATFKFRKEYLVRLSQEVLPSMTYLQQYVKMYEIYCEYAFEEPEVYFNMYFGKYSYKLNAVRDAYYAMFPDEFVEQTSLVQAVTCGKDVYAGERAAVSMLVQEGVIKPENADMVARMVVRVHSSYMYDLCVYKHNSATLCRYEFMDCLMHIIRTNGNT